jgi:CRP-like cAMP-binding protein
MYHLLKRYLLHNSSIGEVDLEKIVPYFKPLKVKKNTILLPQGEVCNRLYFVNKGCIRTYYITGKGDEKSRFIAMEGMIATSLTSFISQQPSFEFVGSLDDSELLYISHGNFYQLLAEYPDWQKFYLTLLESAYLFQNKKIEQLVTLSAGERYAVLMKEHPDFIKRLSNKVLASLLDVTQETLSRLKSQ